MDAATHPAGEKADGAAAHAQADFPQPSVPAPQRGDCENQPDSAGWVQDLAVGHSSRCFSYIRDWVEKKIRHHLARACQRHGFGWKRWSKAWLYGTLGLFHAYRVAH